IVAESPGFVALCPFASRFPYETWILPRGHASQYEQAAAGELAELAPLLHRVLSRIEGAIGSAAYNYLLHNGPFDTTGQSHYHWHIEILPRLTTPAGFEWGAGLHINPVSPEHAASVLRGVAADGPAVADFAGQET